MERKLVTVRKIKCLCPIEGADKIEVAEMHGNEWRVVVMKGQFKQEDNVRAQYSKKTEN